MKREEDNVILLKSKAFALRIIKLFKYLTDEKKEFVLAKQVLRSGTSIGANAKEASMAQSKKDFEAKLSIALKEAGETEYWLELLHEAQYLEAKEYEDIVSPCRAIIRILNAITKTACNNKSHTTHSTFHI